jgi:tetratricopeptide (TPR) repeat protein
VPATSPFSEDDGVCAIRGAEINIDIPSVGPGAGPVPANIEVRNWETDGTDHIFKLANGKYEPGPQLDRPESLEAVRQELFDLKELAMVLMHEGKYEDAAAKFEQAAHLDNGNPELANNAGFAYYKAKQYEKSVFWIEKAIQIDPKRAVAYINLGDTLVELHRNADARQAYKTYLELAPSSKSAADVKKKLGALR